MTHTTFLAQCCLSASLYGVKWSCSCCLYLFMSLNVIYQFSCNLKLITWCPVSLCVDVNWSISQELWNIGDPFDVIITVNSATNFRCMVNYIKSYIVVTMLYSVHMLTYVINFSILIELNYCVYYGFHNYTCCIVYIICMCVYRMSYVSVYPCKIKINPIHCWVCFFPFNWFFVFRLCMFYTTVKSRDQKNNMIIDVDEIYFFYFFHDVCSWTWSEKSIILEW